MHASFEHLGLCDFFFGVEAPEEGLGVDEVDVEGGEMVISGCGCNGSVGVILLDGDDNFSVDDSSSFSSPTVVDGCSGLPSSMSWTSAGRFVEAERNSRTLETV